MKRANQEREEPIEKTFKTTCQIRLEVHVISTTPQATDNDRLFCVLPWEVSDKTKDELFFKNFAKFGTLVYYETVRDKSGKLAYGFVQFFSAKDAKKAKDNCDIEYNATYALSRKPSKVNGDKKKTKFHEKCKKSIDVDVYQLHEITCKKQMKYQQKIDAKSVESHESRNNGKETKENVKEEEKKERKPQDSEGPKEQKTTEISPEKENELLNEDNYEDIDLITT